MRFIFVALVALFSVASAFVPVPATMAPATAAVTAPTECAEMEGREAVVMDLRRRQGRVGCKITGTRGPVRIKHTHGKDRKHKAASLWLKRRRTRTRAQRPGRHTA